MFRFTWFHFEVCFELCRRLHKSQKFQRSITSESSVFGIGIEEHYYPFIPIKTNLNIKLSPFFQKLKSDRLFYEQEIQRILDNAESRVAEIRKLADSEGKPKIFFSKKRRKNINHIFPENFKKNFSEMIFEVSPKFFLILL